MRRETIQRGAIGVKFVGPLLRDFTQRARLVACSLDRFVVNVSEIPNVLHFVGAEFQFEQAAKHIVYDERPKISNMGRRVNGGATVIETENSIRMGRFQFADLSRQRVEEFDRHGKEMGRTAGESKSLHLTGFAMWRKPVPNG